MSRKTGLFCGCCIYFQEATEGERFDTHGWCRRGTPVPMIVAKEGVESYNDVDGVWPTVSSNEWCGEGEHDGSTPGPEEQ